MILNWVSYCYGQPSDKWTFAQAEGGTILQSTQGIDPLTFTQTNMMDVSATIRIQLNGGSMAMHLREGQAGRYTLSLNANGILALYRDTTLLEGTTLAPLGTEWHMLTLSVIGDIVRVKVDDVTLLAVQDNSPLPAGGLSIVSVDGSSLRVDDFALAVPNITQVASVEVVPTDMPTALPTFTPLPPIIEYNTKQAAPQSLQLQPMMAAVSSTVEYTSELISAINNDCTNTTQVVEINLVSVSGTYTLLSPITSTHGDSGLPLIKCNLTINGDPDGDEIGSTITRGGSASAFRIMMVDEGASLTLNDLTVSNGLLYSGGGAGIGSYFGNVTLNNVTVENNRLYYGSYLAIRGAGISVFHGQLNIQNSLIINNANDGYPFGSSPENVRGGGIAIDNGNDVIESNIIDSVISGNFARHGGGGIYADYASLNIERSRIENNGIYDSSPVSGGGIFITNGNKPVTIQNSLFQNNDAVTAGDAIYNVNGDTSIHDSCIIDNNDGNAEVYHWNNSQLDATGNFWGSTNGPGPGQVSGNGNVDTTGYIDYYQPSIPDCLNGFLEPPTPTPTLTPLPPTEPWISSVQFAEEIPPLFLGDYPYYCPTSPGQQGYDNIRYNRDCSLVAFNYYKQQVESTGEQFTWGHFTSLIIYSEGDTRMLGQIDESTGLLIYNNPQLSYENSTCWKYKIDGDNSEWESGSTKCEEGIQKHFPWAVGEFIFNKCSQSDGFPLGTYSTSERDYAGVCHEEGFLDTIDEVESLYKALKNNFPHNSFLYLQRAEYELSLWGLTKDPTNPDSRAYGQCPCSWENVGTESAARQGRTNGNSYSYFDNGVTGDPFRYFRIY